MSFISHKKILIRIELLWNLWIIIPSLTNKLVSKVVYRILKMLNFYLAFSINVLATINWRNTSNKINFSGKRKKIVRLLSIIFLLLEDCSVQKKKKETYVMCLIRFKIVFLSVFVKSGNIDGTASISEAGLQLYSCKASADENRSRLVLYTERTCLACWSWDFTRLESQSSLSSFLVITIGA